MKALWLVVLVGCAGGLQTPPQAEEVQNDCDRFLAVFAEAKDAGLTCPEGLAKAQQATAYCKIQVKCKGVDGGISE